MGRGPNVERRINDRGTLFSSNLALPPAQGQNRAKDVSDELSPDK